MWRAFYRLFLGVLMFVDADGSVQAAYSAPLPVERTSPTFSGAVEWLNSPPLTLAGLRGKVVVVDFWTYTCINSLRNLPHLRAWAEKYREKGLVVIGVHSPEFSFESDLDNVRRETERIGIPFPVAVDSNHAIWEAFDNEAWPADYFIDAKGRVRYHHYGEGGIEQSEAVIRQLLAENDKGELPGGTVQPKGSGVEAAADFAQLASPETYLGYERTADFASPGGIVRDRSHAYVAPGHLRLNQWALDGSWTAGGESVALDQAPGRVIFRFHARDVNLILSAGEGRGPIRFRVRIDGRAPGADRGVDVGRDGAGTLTDARMYQLIRQHGPIADHTFDIEFFDPQARAFDFTFG
jgi:thiol-disulfide isomerase/thioredoxin